MHLASCAAVYRPRPEPGSHAFARVRAEAALRSAFLAPRRYAVLRLFNLAGGAPWYRHRPRGALFDAACAAASGRGPPVTVHVTDWLTADGTCVRDYLHPADAASALASALETIENGAVHLTLDCGTGVGHTVLQVLAAVGRAAGREVPYVAGPRRPGDVAVSIADAEPARRALKWRPVHSGLATIAASALHCTHTPDPETSA